MMDMTLLVYQCAMEYTAILSMTKTEKLNSPFTFFSLILAP